MKALLLLLLPLAAAEPGQLLRDGLYAEEVERDPATAAGHYREIVAGYDAQRPLAASAMFRLAEITLASGDTETATALFQRLVREFPDTAAEVERARRRLAELGVELPTEAEPDHAGQRELLRLRELAESAPEMLRDADTLERAAAEGWTEVVRFLLDHGADPNHGQALVRATETANLAVCRLLVEHAEPAPELAGKALASAIEKDRVGLLQALLELGLPAQDNLLHLAVIRSSSEAVRLLAEHGAGLTSLNVLEPGRREPLRGTPLHRAVLEQKPELARLLIELGTPVDAAAPDSDFTPLVAGARSPDASQIQLLLDHGANPNQPRALAQLLSEPSPPGREAAEALLEAGCDPNAGGVPAILRVLYWRLKDLKEADERSRAHQEQVRLIELLLRHGADPNAPFGTYSRNAAGPNMQSNSLVKRSPFLPLERAMASIRETPLLKVVETAEDHGLINLSLIDLLLEAGALPGEGYPEIFQFVANHADEDDLELVERLIELRPDELHLEVSGYATKWSNPVKRLFLDRVLVPELRSRGGVQAVLTEDFGTRELVAADQEPPALHELLLGELDWVSQHLDDESTPPTVALFRQEASGEVRRTEIDLAGADELPELQSGDVLEITRIKTEPNRSLSSSRSSAYRKFTWQLRRHLEVPITLEIGEESQPLTLRGDCLVFNPTRDVAPILPAGLLAARIWNLGYQLDADSVPRPKLQIVRDGWGEVPIDWGDSSFELQPGDVMRVVPPENLDELRRDYRSRQIGLRIPGHAYGRDCPTGTLEADAFVNPTLVAFLADSLAEALPRPDGDEPDLAQLAADLSSLPTVLPHPDFSAIRIRRLEEDGGESLLKVDLAAAIAACTDDTPPEEPRSADLQLRPGDVVELPLLPLDEPYRGFSEAQARFFAKVLSGNLQVFPRDQAPQLHRLDWQPTRWRETEAGWLPFDPAQGTASTRMWPGSEFRHRLIGNAESVEVERSGERSGSHEPSQVFLRDGDRLYVSGQPTQPRVQPLPNPPPVRATREVRPRPRVVPSSR